VEEGRLTHTVISLFLVCGMSKRILPLDEFSEQGESEERD